MNENDKGIKAGHSALVGGLFSFREDWASEASLAS